ncbi:MULTISPECIES: hypothetical protein [unclassified Streptomyces]|uniref:hypothetical protein n=1 Tax=unclassified Streptomyces TaxID=2593676 RepID=UPI00278C60F9|nr:MULTISPECIES: hypothetical protein [unclassified Streptomyces]
MTHGDGQQNVPTGGFGAPPPPFAPAPPPHPPAVPPAPPAPPGPPAAPAAPPMPPGVPPAQAAGPEFIAADEYNGVVVDAEGVHFEQGPHAIDLPWAQLRTVQFQPLPQGLSVAAVTAQGPVYECRVRARRKSQATQWLTDLPGVLHHYLQGR